MRLDGSDLSIIVPLWKRTSHITRLIVSARAATPHAEIVFVASIDDTVVLDALQARSLDESVVAKWPGGAAGDYAKKINLGYRATSRPFIFTGADDLHFPLGWYDEARIAAAAREMGAYGDRIGVVGTNDLCNHRTINGTHSTHSLVARWYADLGGTLDQDHVIYHEGYAHEYCDDELVQTAMFRGAYAHAHAAIVEHLHPNAQKSPDDETYRRGRSLSRLSRRLYISRRRMWGERGALRNRA